MSDLSERIKATFQDYEISRLRNLYEMYSNPLFAWKAYQFARKHNRALPDWVQIYLDEVADELQNLNPEGNHIRAKLPRALKLSSAGRSDWAKFEKQELKLQVLTAFARLQRSNPTWTDRETFDELAATFDLDQTQISKWYYELLRKLDQ